MRIRRVLSAATALFSLQTECLDALLVRTTALQAPSTFWHQNRPAHQRSNVRIFSESDVGNSNVDEDNDSVLLASLKKRSQELEIQNETLLNRWKDANCSSKARIVIDDWVRRVSLGKWPYIAAGSARGSIYLADCNTCEVVAQVNDVHSPMGGAEEAITYLYGPYDGGGTLAIATMGTIVASAGREGGVKIFQIITPEEDEKPPLKKKKLVRVDDKPPLKKKLVPAGEIDSLKSALVTSLVLDDDEKLWVGCYGGTLHMFDLDSATPQKNTTYRLESGVLCVDVNNDIGLVVCGMTNGSIKMFSIDGTVLALWKPFSTTFVRSVKVIGGPDDDSWCVVAGGGDGQISAQQLLVDSTGTIETVPFDNQQRKTIHFSPRHGAAVVSFAARQGGLLISGAQDGTIRVWDCWEKSSDASSNHSRYDVKPKLLYNFVGYKAWLGSVCSDGNCLLSDGSDNAIIVHDFTVPIDYDV